MKMSRKMGYDTETHHFYFCEFCGKEKWVVVEQEGRRCEKN
jgi:hypothetical protein